MKLLKIEDHCGHFLAESSSYEPIDKISKEDLLRLVNASLGDDAVSYTHLTLPTKA